ncbi:MAG: DUF4290 domain-containing protein [Rikenellaceae bacterium]|nr:DUF4290 domain-containing protein [Rikenellaceae bacterium]MCL2692234.1 DUF4290 domain-containing protein [Rikenellaceae bacterium]
MKKNYNYERKKLRLPEYGRHIHEMVDYLSTIEDRDERNRQARAVIGVMGNLFPMLRDTADYTHKLWDHLFIMADFRLDVDSPYPIPSAEELAPHPARMSYPSRRIAIKHYGKNVENILRSLSAAGDTGAVGEVVANVARYMRAKGYEYNQEHPNNESVIKDIKRLSDNAVFVDESVIDAMRSEYKQHHSAHQKKTAHQNGRQNKCVKNGKTSSGRGAGSHRERMK